MSLLDRVTTLYEDHVASKVKESTEAQRARLEFQGMIEELHESLRVVKDIAADDCAQFWADFTDAMCDGVAASATLVGNTISIRAYFDATCNLCSISVYPSSEHTAEKVCSITLADFRDLPDDRPAFEDEVLLLIKEKLA